MTLQDLIKQFQRAIGVKDDGVFGPVTTAKAEEYDVEIKVTKKPVVEKPVVAPAPGKSANPAYNHSKQFGGMGEHVKSFVARMSSYWPKAGLPGYKTIIGSSFAWCGLFILAMNSDVGQKWVSGAAGAKNWAKYGVEIDYKKNGAPRGAVVHINHNKCGSGSGNHVAFLDGDCTAHDLTRSGGTVALWGGNQGNKVKRSVYSNREVCAVRWPAELPLPGPVTKSVDCTGEKPSGESTR